MDVEVKLQRRSSTVASVKAAQSALRAASQSLFAAEHSNRNAGGLFHDVSWCLQILQVQITFVSLFIKTVSVEHSVQS